MKDHQLLMAAEAAKASYNAPRQTINGTGIYYSFGEGILHIAFSGTQNTADVRTDLRFLPNLSGCHRGFFNRAKSLLETVVEIIDKNSYQRDIQIYLVGHSLGGAMAQILCKMLKGKYKYLSAITFGSPRVWLKFNNPKVDHIRVEHRDDPVPKLLPIFYRHYDTKHLQIGEDEVLLDVNDHKIETYIKLLEK